MLPCVVDDTLQQTPTVKDIAVGHCNGVLYFAEPCAGIFVQDASALSDEQRNFIWDIEDFTDEQGESGTAYIGNQTSGNYFAEDGEDFFFVLHVDGELRPGTPLVKGTQFGMKSYTPFAKFEGDVPCYGNSSVFQGHVVLTPVSLTVSRPLMAFDPKSIMQDDEQSDAFEAWFIMKSTAGEDWTIPIYRRPKDDTPFAYMYWEQNGAFSFYDHMDTEIDDPGVVTH